MARQYLSLAAVVAAAASVATLAVADEAERKGIAAPPGHVFKTIISGYEFRSKETRALQDDDLENPGFLAVERAADAWKKVEGSEGKSCMSCHGEAVTSMKGVGAAMPKWDDKLKKPVNLEQRINICRSEHMKAEPWKFKSRELTDMTAFVRYQSHGMPVAVKTDGP
ncbi:MAG: sulfur oxidation c-type cytochrome SoxA, partial [Bradyrhizobiaceae bacterium]